MRLQIGLTWLIVFLCASCQSDQMQYTTKMTPDKFYQRDMVVNGHLGVAVFPKQLSYNLHVETHGDIDLFTMKTLAKEETKERAWNVTQKVKSGLFGWGSKRIDKKREVQFTYVPSAIEIRRNSVMELEARAFTAGRHSFFYAAFEDPKKYALPATLSCNGRDIKANGVSICQARAGLYQSITFKKEVSIAGDVQCGLTGAGDYKMQLGRCVVLLKDKETGKIHKHITIGYDGLLPAKRK